MAGVFPFGFPGPTAFYLSLYVLTLAVHALFVSYVLAGTGYLAAVHFFPGGAGGQRHRGPLAETLRDWMPFGLSAAITAGVAPLLFVQILYKENFYTANLLLFHRWMAILPVLIAGFYFLYILRTSWAREARPAWGGAIALAAWLCFAFTGYSWTENHLLSTQRSIWPAFYGSGAIFFRSPGLLPRLALWLAGSLPVMAALAGWQLHLGRAPTGPAAAGEARRLAGLALAGLLLGAAAGAWYFGLLPERARAALTGAMAGPYLILAACGFAAQAAAWLATWRNRRFSRGSLALAAAGAFLTAVGVAVAREAARLAAMRLPPLYALHARAAAVGGLAAFLFFLMLNAALIAWCVALVVRGRRAAPDEN